MVRLRQSTRSIAVLSVDIDGFKRVNDSVGPTLGDRLLSEASIRIATAVSENDTVARLGSDTFAVMIPEAEPAEASRVALAILEAFHAPFVPDGRELVVTVSIGVAMYPEDGNDALRLLQTRRLCDGAGEGERWQRGRVLRNGDERHAPSVVTRSRPICAER